ncbi:hypothetical protein JCM14036_10410 [Desulfotomaculum defluvii]
MEPKLLNVSEIRKNFKEVISEVVETKIPILIIQRSKPVAYLVDAETFNNLKQQNKG